MFSQFKKNASNLDLTKIKSKRPSFSTTISAKDLERLGLPALPNHVKPVQDNPVQLNKEVKAKSPESFGKSVFENLKVQTQSYWQKLTIKEVVKRVEKKLPVATEIVTPIKEALPPLPTSVLAKVELKQHVMMPPEPVLSPTEQAFEVLKQNLRLYSKQEAESLINGSLDPVARAVLMKAYRCVFPQK